MSVLVTFIFQNNVLYCPISENIVPKVTFQACNNTMYCPFQTPVYLKKAFIVPYRTVLSQKSLFSHVITTFIVRSDTLKLLKNTLLCPISDCIVLKVTLIFFTKSTWLDIISNWRFEFNDLFARKCRFLLSHNSRLVMS